VENFGGQVLDRVTVIDDFARAADGSARSEEFSGSPDAQCSSVYHDPVAFERTLDAASVSTPPARPDRSGGGAGPGAQTPGRPPGGLPVAHEDEVYRSMTAWRTDVLGNPNRSRIT